MADVLITAPQSEPLTTAEAKDHLRVEHTDDDTYIGTLIVAARRFVEERTGRALVTQTWERVLDAFPAELELARGSLQEVTSVKYVDEAGVEQTLETAQYLVDDDREPGRIVPAYGCTWPATRQQINAVRVRYVAGFGDAAAVPADIKAAMKLLIGHLYEHRESEITGTITSSHQLAIDALLAPHILNRVG